MSEAHSDHRKRKKIPALLSLADDASAVRKSLPGGPAMTGLDAAPARSADAADRHRTARAGRDTKRTNPLLAELAAQDRRESQQMAAAADSSFTVEPAPNPTAAHNTPARDSDAFQPLIDPALLAGTIWDWRYRIVALSAAGFVAGAMIALATPHKYTAYSQILVDPREVKLVGRDIAPDFLANEAALAIVDSQLELVKAASVLRKVVDRTNLDQDPEFNGTTRGLGVPKSFSDFISLFSGHDAVESRDHQAVKNLRDSLWARRTNRTFVIQLGVESRNPEKSAQLANELTTAFIEQQEQLMSGSARDASNALGARIGDLRADVKEAEQALESYRAQSGLIGPGGRLVTDDQLAAVTAQLAEAKGATIAAKSRAEAAKAVNAASVIAGGLPQDITSSSLSALRTQHGALKQQLASLENALGPRHPKLADAKAALGSLESEISAEVRRIVSGTQADLRRAVQNEQALAGSLAELKAESAGNNESQIRLRELERGLAIAREIYEAFLLRARETGELEALGSTNVKIIAQAEAPEDPSTPSRKIVAAGFGVSGFLVGLVLAFLSAVRQTFTGDPAGGGGTRRLRRKHDTQQVAHKTAGDRVSVSAGAPAKASAEQKPVEEPQPPLSPYYPQNGMHPASMPTPGYHGHAAATPYPPTPHPYSPQYGAFPQPPSWHYPDANAETAPSANAAAGVTPPDEEELRDLRQSLREIRETVDALIRRRADKGRRVA